MKAGSGNFAGASVQKAYHARRTEKKARERFGPGYFDLANRRDSVAIRLAPWLES
jgi:hypothetical protein